MFNKKQGLHFNDVSYLTMIKCTIKFNTALKNPRCSSKTWVPDPKIKKPVPKLGKTWVPDPGQKFSN